MPNQSPAGAGRHCQVREGGGEVNKHVAHYSTREDGAQAGQPPAGTLQTTAVQPPSFEPIPRVPRGPRGSQGVPPLPILSFHFSSRRIFTLPSSTPCLPRGVSDTAKNTSSGRTKGAPLH